MLFQHPFATSTLFFYSPVSSGHAYLAVLKWLRRGEKWHGECQYMKPLCMETMNQISIANIGC